MQRVVTRLKDDEKTAWQNFCRDRSISESDMLRMMIKQVSIGEVATESPGIVEKKSEKITIRITGKDKFRIIKRAKKEGYPSRTSWVTSLVLAALHREPVLTQDEITTLRESNRQLAAIGRNLNQLVRALNSDARAINRITRAEVKDLADQIEGHKGKVAELLNQNLNRWGTENE
jgi:predicted DNA binding CopG/RHH family protein